MVTINEKPVGDGHPVFITFEAGATHTGYDSARQLADHAARAGADAIKFQIFDPDRLVADKSLPFSYEILVDKKSGKTQTVTEPLYDIFVRRYMPSKDWKRLIEYCNGLGLAFFATACFEEDIDLLIDTECDSIKIASADVDHFPLIEKAAKTGKCIQLDTGNASFGEIEEAVDLIHQCGNRRIIIHNCPSGYPARLESINLRLIPSLKQMFEYPIAFSDHTPGHDMDIAAVAMGANLVEKTITLDRTIPSTEHIFSLEPGEMQNFVTCIRELETALGHPRRVLHPEEKETRRAVRRSIFIKEAVQKGQRLGDVAVDFRRPGFGISPKYYKEAASRVFTRDLPAGHMPGPGDLK